MEHNANQFKQQGNNAYKSGDYRKALALYTKAIELNPKQPAFYLNRALCYFNLKQYHDCVTECNRSLQLNHGYIKALKKKAAALVQMLKFDEALNVLKNANTVEKSQATMNEIEQVQHFVSNYHKYIEALKTENYPEALSCVAYLVSKIPDNKELKLIKIECLAKTGATEEGLKQLRSIDHQKTPETMYLKGIIELYSGDSAKAKSYFSQGIRLDPENTKCQKALSKANKCERFKEEGNQLIKAQNWAGAEAKYTEGLHLDPYNKKLNSIIYSNRALTFMKRKMWTKAAEDLNKSIQLNPNYLKSYVKRAQVSMQRGQYTAAIQDYAKIQQLDPKIDLKAKIHQAKKKQKQAKKKDYYAILNVPKTATDDQIKKAYKKMALKYHPDRNRNKSQVEQEQASKMFRDINQAQDILTDKEKRKLYDSGAMHADQEMGDGFDGFQQGNMGGFQQGGFGNMGGNGQSFTFRMNGQEMGGIDPSEIFSMFMGGRGGGFGGFGGKQTRGKSAFKTQTGQGNKFQGFNGFNGFGFQGF